MTYNLDFAAGRIESARRVNNSMPYSSFSFLQFKWWSTPGLDMAVWICQKQFFDENTRSKLKTQIVDTTDLEWTKIMINILQTGYPDILTRLNNGTENIWITDLHIAQCQRSGSFPKIFTGEVNSIMAGITIKKIPGSDRQTPNVNDIALDVIITICPPSDILTNPVLHRQHIPQWTDTQISQNGRYTTGPLFTHWTKI